MRVVYKDTQGAEYSAPVVQQGDKWVMQTADGLLLPIAYIFTDDRAGRLMFSHYREDQPPAEPDKLHLLPRQPGESSFQQLQRSVGVGELQARAERQREVQNQVAKADTRDAARAQIERHNNNLLATRWSRSRPDPVSPQTPSKEVIAEAARWRKRKEPET